MCGWPAPTPRPALPPMPAPSTRRQAAIAPAARFAAQASTAVSAHPEASATPSLQGTGRSARRPQLQQLMRLRSGQRAADSSQQQQQMRQQKNADTRRGGQLKNLQHAAGESHPRAYLRPDLQPDPARTTVAEGPTGGGGGTSARSPRHAETPRYGTAESSPPRSGTGAAGQGRRAAQARGEGAQRRRRARGSTAPMAKAERCRFCSSPRLACLQQQYR